MVKIVSICFSLAIIGIGALSYNVNKTTQKGVSEKIMNSEEKLSKEDIVSGVEKISQDYAKRIIDSDIEFVLLDVRSQEEYDEKHLKDSLLIPDNELQERVEKEIPNKDELILIYCRSGNRSGSSTKVLSSMGYTNVKDFGGLNSWQYEVETK